MIFRGTVQGADARKYAGYTYRKPLKSHVDIWQLDPERLSPWNEYPRSVNPPGQPNLKYVDLADYSVNVSGPDSCCMCTVQVWMQPNQYTEARTPLLVFEFKVAHALTHQHEYRDEALRCAFNDLHRMRSQSTYRIFSASTSIVGR